MVERKISTERLYHLGDYKSLRVGDSMYNRPKVANEISGIPEELWLNPEFINKLRYLQLVQMETVYFKYIEDFIKNYHMNRSLEDTIGIIDELGELEIKTIKELKDILEIGD